ncbi:hypothetical protein ACIQ4I_08160 [Rummeliibacillus sp. NPDC094406]|uniref:hypothetical protein n=1 Tax=Rummeliibacillus sp. NPDC094406 TaxID=3364511 RepID=UPI003829B54B
MHKRLIYIPAILGIITIIFLIPNLSAQALSNKPGDIIITKNTSAKGILGHTGIFIGSNQILHASGWKSEPYPIIFTKKQWEERYGNSKVIRPKSAKLGEKAADKAISSFTKYDKKKKKRVGKHIPYKISRNPENIKETYCSELIWYSYYKVGKSYKVSVPYYGFAEPDIIEPYDYIKPTLVDYNGFKFVDNTWSKQ